MAGAKFSTSLYTLNAIFREAIPLFAQSGFDRVSAGKLLLFCYILLHH